MTDEEYEEAKIKKKEIVKKLKEEGKIPPDMVDFPIEAIPERLRGSLPEKRYNGDGVPEPEGWRQSLGHKMQVQGSGFGFGMWNS